MSSNTPFTMCMTALAAALAVAGFSAAGAQDATETGIEAREGDGTAESFTPPLTGAPEKRMGAASRELGPARPGCEEQATDEQADGDCAEGAANSPEAEEADTEGASGQ